MAFAHTTRRGRRRGHSPLAAPLIVLLIAGAVAATYVGYLLWPRWPDAPVALDAPALPIVVAGTAFNIDPAAIRMRVQRHPGTQARVDLAYVWPTLTPPDPAEKSPPPGAPPTPLERLFISIEGADGTMSPIQRVETIYPRYLESDASTVEDTLMVQAFRTGTPYAGEDLYMADGASFTARCSRDAQTPGMCLSERRIGDADLHFRFPRAWLAHWRDVADAMDKLSNQLQGPGK